MSRRILVSLAFVAACAASCLAPSRALSQELVRERLKSDVGIELLGKGVLYTFYYQYTPNKMIGLEAGLGLLGGGSGDDNATIAFFPIGAKLYLIPKDGSLFLAGGVTIVTAGTDAGPFEDSTHFGYGGLGFEYRGDSGILFRGTAYAFIGGDDFFIWPGLTIGYTF